jgi:predicted nucleic acid-binding protein
VKAYLDSSVLLRVVLAEPKRLPEWSRITEAVTSEITRVECLRVLDRLRRAGSMDDRELARRRATMLQLLSGMETIRLNRAVLDRASEPFPTQIRTLDAVHLASALLQSGRIAALRFATHDDELATAATAVGFRVIGAANPTGSGGTGVSK